MFRKHQFVEVGWLGRYLSNGAFCQWIVSIRKHELTHGIHDRIRPRPSQIIMSRDDRDEQCGLIHKRQDCL